jgi:hypothetical protein
MNIQTTLSNVIRMACVGAVSLALFGCATVQMPVPTTASADNLSTLRAANLAPAKAGAFVLAPGKPAALDTTLDGLRGSSVEPANGSFAKTLREELVVELKAAGLYDETSNTVITGQLTDSQVDAAIGTGTGRLGAHFTVTRDGKSVYDKTLTVDAKWESSFVGAIALPAAINQYTALYKTLAGKLFADADFQKALAK